jgi:hypothetical protein
MLEDCYFIADNSLPEKERKMKVLCTKCQKERMPKAGWFWKGSSLGYGPFNFICCLCGHVVYSPTKNEKEEKTSS